MGESSDCQRSGALRSCLLRFVKLREKSCASPLVMRGGWEWSEERCLYIHNHNHTRPRLDKNVKSVGSNVAAARHASRRQHGGSGHRHPNQSPRAIRLVTRPQARRAHAVRSSATRSRHRLLYSLPRSRPAHAVHGGSPRPTKTTCAPKTCTKGNLARPGTCGHKSSAPDVSQRLAFQMKACSCCVDCESTLSGPTQPYIELEDMCERSTGRRVAGGRDTALDRPIRSY